MIHFSDDLHKLLTEGLLQKPLASHIRPVNLRLGSFMLDWAPTHSWNLNGIGTQTLIYQNTSQPLILQRQSWNSHEPCTLLSHQHYVLPNGQSVKMFPEDVRTCGRHTIYRPAYRKLSAPTSLTSSLRNRINLGEIQTWK